MITVSIVTYKTNLGELSKCLQSLISSLVSQIYIVDNSNERYIADFCQQYPNVIYIGSENVGYGAGHNQALRQVLNSGGRYHQGLYLCEGTGAVHALQIGTSRQWGGTV